MFLLAGPAPPMPPSEWQTRHERSLYSGLRARHLGIERRRGGALAAA